MWVDGANPNTPKTPPSRSWGRFLAHISQIKQKVLEGYKCIGTWFSGKTISMKILILIWSFMTNQKVAILKMGYLLNYEYKVY